MLEFRCWELLPLSLIWREDDLPRLEKRICSECWGTNGVGAKWLSDDPWLHERCLNNLRCIHKWRLQDRRRLSNDKGWSENLSWLWETLWLGWDLLELNLLWLLQLYNRLSLSDNLCLELLLWDLLSYEIWLYASYISSRKIKRLSNNSWNSNLSRRRLNKRCCCCWCKSRLLEINLLKWRNWSNNLALEQNISSSCLLWLNNRVKLNLRAS